MKYDEWVLRDTSDDDVARLISAGFSPLVARVLCARGFSDLSQARAFVADDDGALHDPFLLNDMDKAVARIRRGIADKETIAVYGDYDVDGMTSVSMLTHYLRASGADVTSYIPERLTQGYGLNLGALQSLSSRGVTLVVTVDVGVTAIEETRAASQQGLDLVITDHHLCRPVLPAACAVVNPHRADSVYPFPDLAGVGVAFKLICALSGGADAQRGLLDVYGDLVALGAIADVVPLVGENRELVKVGLSLLAQGRHIGLKNLLLETGAQARKLTASTVSYTLAPNLNAAGRMGHTSVAVELLSSPEGAGTQRLAMELCELNRQRKKVENQIFFDALSMLEHAPEEGAIVLASDLWHCGVVGIVAARLSEHFRRPAFLICLDGDVGKGSARNAGSLHLVALLEKSSDLLLGYGGHEQAAGFTIHKDAIDAFRSRLRDLLAGAPAYTRRLLLDCAPDVSLLTMAHVCELSALEPCGAGNPPPRFCLPNVLLTELKSIGGGRHIRLAFQCQDHTLPGVFFGVEARAFCFAVGDRVDVAFQAEINTFQNRKSVQLIVTDLRLSSPQRQEEMLETRLYQAFVAGQPFSAADLSLILPTRDDLAAVWRYLSLKACAEPITANLAALTRKVARASARPRNFAKAALALDIFEELSLIKTWRVGDEITVATSSRQTKTDLALSPTWNRLHTMLCAD